MGKQSGSSRRFRLGVLISGRQPFRELEGRTGQHLRMDPAFAQVRHCGFAHGYLRAPELPEADPTNVCCLPTMAIVVGPLLLLTEPSPFV
jgi:hypothetical protein